MLAERLVIVDADESQRALQAGYLDAMPSGSAGVTQTSPSQVTACMGPTMLTAEAPNCELPAGRVNR